MPTVEFEGEQAAGNDIDIAEQYNSYALLADVRDSEGLEPLTLAEAKRRSDWPLWEQVIKKELEMLKTMGTWELTERPPNVNVVG
jgi:hypothetical protein